MTFRVEAAVDNNPRPTKRRKKPNAGCGVGRELQKKAVLSQGAWPLDRVAAIPSYAFAWDAEPIEIWHIRGMESRRSGKLISEHMVLGSAFCLLAIMIVGSMMYLLRPKSPQASNSPSLGHPAGSVEDSSTGQDTAESAGQEGSLSELNARIKGKAETGEAANSDR